MYRRTIRTALVTTALVAAVLAVTVDATGRGKTNEIPASDIGHAAAWPIMPANCLGGGSARDVRMVGTVADAKVMAHAEINVGRPAQQTPARAISFAARMRQACLT